MAGNSASLPLLHHRKYGPSHPGPCVALAPAVGPVDYRIAWAPIWAVEVGNDGSLVLHGDDKRFVLAPASYWSGKDKSAALALLGRKLEHLALSSYRTNIGDYKTHKNVRP